ncbi:hypothetical protein F442_03291 [Phytophthora nicotianae P10297]|uniref:Uncharacterized protein n=4 Tax=Phytophthora nicotianae TaxID=4792 RepID=W2QMR7_PHYN3|nr:hypothetical protein PPTG_07885 [Phytophthora nicotianae INRA-310]ETK93610.1 hypothetical protein L915_03247 [Phytophthora nicotianae]ETO82477.1 hypothetical protein F444_03385 [Phytophthora nicotianae P1976]ETP51587.1 hypothetical protein F442_03291 [Phytophthora nicotianae P10297]ETL47003.1 hypothetical protein L916_03215 [Phytophthora nicotianae]ETM00103.1 hypothetical protein L917_03143 [Phytophthora nicotianae]
MPRINSTWNPVMERGNPTRSDEVNKPIKKVKKFEIRREGAESNVRRPVELDEFLSLLMLMRTKRVDTNTAYMGGSVLILQWDMCARIDDMMKLQSRSFSPNTQYLSTLLFQLR